MERVTMESAAEAPEVNRQHCPCRIHRARRNTTRADGMDGTRVDRMDIMDRTGSRGEERNNNIIKFINSHLIN